MYESKSMNEGRVLGPCACPQPHPARAPTTLYATLDQVRGITARNCGVVAYYTRVKIEVLGPRARVLASTYALLV